ncbi:hypothetical protein [Streptomyces sp. SM10]|uniref:hypothetical protein n=1 Tax=Streptomyces sp. SM10 TaxID=565556 RepID=UPI0021564B30|nr:hypothetical protein [Streptomyces sp. SM10]
MAASIARERLKLQLDISFGAPVTPGLTTAISLGDLNTRERDDADLYGLLTLNNLNGEEPAAALTATATYRGIELKPLSAAITDLAARAPPGQMRTAAWKLPMVFIDS